MTASLYQRGSPSVEAVSTASGRLRRATAHSYPRSGAGRQRRRQEARCLAAGCDAGARMVPGQRRWCQRRSVSLSRPAASTIFISHAGHVTCVPVRPSGLRGLCLRLVMAPRANDAGGGVASGGTPDLQLDAGSAFFSSWYSASTLTLQMSWLAPKMFSTESMAVYMEWSWLLYLCIPLRPTGKTFGVCSSSQARMVSTWAL